MISKPTKYPKRKVHVKNNREYIVVAHKHYYISTDTNTNLVIRYDNGIPFVVVNGDRYNIE